MSTQETINYQRIADAINYIKLNFKEQPNLDDVAEKVNLSPFHFQRMFTDWAGISPKKFLQYLSLDYAKGILKENQATLFDAAFETGLSGTGRLHDLFINIEGMTPGEYKKGGEALTIYYSVQQCRFGKYIVASTGKGICNLYFFEGKNDGAIDALREFWPHAKLIYGTDDNQQKIIQFFNNDYADTSSIKLHLKGTPFQLKVWL